MCSKIRIVCIFEDVFFLWSSGGQGLQIGLLKVLKMDSLSKNTPSSPSTFGGCPSSRGTTLIFMIMYYMNGLCSAVMCIVVVVVWLGWRSVWVEL